MVVPGIVTTGTGRRAVPAKSFVILRRNDSETPGLKVSVNNGVKPAELLGVTAQPRSPLTPVVPM